VLNPGEVAHAEGNLDVDSPDDEGEHRRPMEGMSVGLPLGKDAEAENKHTVRKNVERDA